MSLRTIASIRRKSLYWDGETFEYKNSLPSDKVAWWQLTEDGSRCLYLIGGANRDLLLLKYVNLQGGPLSVWDIAGGKTEQSVPISDGNAESKIRGMAASPDGKFLAFIMQPPKAKDTEGSLVVWEIGAGAAPQLEIRKKFEIKPGQKIREYGVIISDHGKYVALDLSKTVQIYETQTGEKKIEMENVNPPGYFHFNRYWGNRWLNDDQILLYERRSELKAVEVATGRQVYQEKLVFAAYNVSASDGVGGYTNTELVISDSTEIVPHPNGKIFLTYSNQYVKVFDSRTGELLQTVVSPQMDYTKKKPEPSKKALVSKAGWADDGKMLYIIDAQGETVSLWRLLAS